MNNQTTYKRTDIKWMPEIPSHWEVRRLKNVCRFIYGSTLKAQERNENGNVNVYGSNGIVGKHDEAISEMPCIIIGRKGSFGKINFSHEKCFPIDTTYYVDKTSTSENIYWVAYLLEYLKLDAFSKDSAVPGLAREDAYEKYVPVPPAGEQDEIVKHLNNQSKKINHFIKRKQRFIELLQEQRQSIITHAVTKGIDENVTMKETGINWIGQVPQHWELRRLKTIVDFKSGENITGESISASAAYPVYGGNGIRGYTNKFTNHGNYVLIGRQGALCGNINYASGKFWASEHAVVVYPKVDLDFTWLGETLTTMNLNQYSMAAAQPGLAIENIRVLRIPFPSIEEQQAIVNYIRAETKTLDIAITKAEKEIELMKEYKEAMIAEAITGRRGN